MKTRPGNSLAFLYFIPTGTQPFITMLTYPQFDPVALQLGPLAIHWYGLMYLIGFALVWLFGRLRIKRGHTDLAMRDLEDIIFYSVIGVVLGGRLGYAIFYQPEAFAHNPLRILYLWEGGMSFHGGLLGVLVVLLLIARKKKKPFLEITDFIAPLVPLGLAAGRLGNFINGELWGRPTNASWGMIFPQSGDLLPRHPSQLYEMALEGVVLFLILWMLARKPRPIGQLSAFFLTGYGVFRFCVEYTREPDAFLGLFAAGLSMGQLLTLPMILAGMLIYAASVKKPTPTQKP
jgi:phosphatidylglycerol:prolipoprotein diacylglycerol transferase